MTEKLFKSVSSYIDENYISSKEIEEYKDRLSRQAQTDVIMRGMRPDVFEENEPGRMMESTSVEEVCEIDCMAYRDLAEEYDLPDDCIIGAPFRDYEDLNKRIDKSASVDIDDMLQNLDAGFSETLLQLIDKTGKKDSEIYKKANVDRKLFSKIRNNIDYKPSKSTALLDAVGGAITHIGRIHKYARKEDVPKKTLFIITTDGMENASHHYTYEKVRHMIERNKKRFGWEFIFLGANIDAAAEAKRFGIDEDMAADYHCDEAGTALNYEVISDVISCARACASVSADWKQRIDSDYKKRGGKRRK